MIWNLIGSIGGKVVDIADDLVEDKGEANRLKFEIQRQLIENKSSELEAAAKGGKIQEIAWDGTVEWEYQDDNQHHDFRRCESGNTIYLGWEVLPPEAAARVQGGQSGTEHENGIYGDYIREVNSAGETVWEWHAHENLEIEK